MISTPADAILHSLKAAASVLRWTVRILGLAVIGLLLAFMMGEGFKFWRFTPKELTLAGVYKAP